jgi:DNA-directed RNA polymerase specialized sigma24 family protein
MNPTDLAPEAPSPQSLDPAIGEALRPYILALRAFFARFTFTQVTVTGGEFVALVAADQARFLAAVRRVTRFLAAEGTGVIDPDDLFQATCLAFLRRSKVTYNPERVVGLFGFTAKRTALNILKADQARRARERAAFEQGGRVHGTLPGVADLFGSAVRVNPPAWDLAEEAIRNVAGYAPLQVEAFVLVDYEGLSTRAAADRLGVPEGTVNSRAKRGRDRVRAEFARLVEGRLSTRVA